MGRGEGREEEEEEGTRDNDEEEGAAEIGCDAAMPLIACNSGLVSASSFDSSRLLMLADDVSSTTRIVGIVSSNVVIPALPVGVDELVA